MSKQKFESDSAVYWGKKEPKESKKDKKKKKGKGKKAKTEKASEKKSAKDPKPKDKDAKGKDAKPKAEKDKKSKKAKKSREYIVYVEAGDKKVEKPVSADEPAEPVATAKAEEPSAAPKAPKPTVEAEPEEEPVLPEAEAEAPEAACAEPTADDSTSDARAEADAALEAVEAATASPKWDPGKTAMFDALGAPSRDGDDDVLAADAIQTLKDAAAAGDPSAMRSLGNRYMGGNGVPQNFDLMREWWERAAQAGNTTAMWDLGYYYVIGMYLDQDIDRGVAWFRLAVENGNANAAFQLGLFYGTGMFVEKNYDEARRWFREALRLGREDAQEEIDECERLLEEGAEDESSKGPRGGNIQIDHLTRKFGRKVVLDDITLTIKGGELVAIVGSSGGGKSTLGSIILGTLRPSKGKVTFGGSLGFVPQQNLVHEYLTVGQQLDFYARSVKHLHGEEAKERKAWVLRELGLEESRGTLIRKCSGGEKRRVSVACELLSSPDGLLLDEPTSGLDPGDSGNLVAMLHGLVHNNRMTALVINHDYENIQLFDKIVFLAHGKVCFYGTPDKLFEYFDTTSTREIYTLMDRDPGPFIRRFEEWCASHPDELGGIC